MIDTKENGIHVQDVMPLNEVTTIDWDIVLCHFMWVRVLSEQKEEFANTLQCELSHDSHDECQ